MKASGSVGTVGASKRVQSRDQALTSRGVSDGGFKSILRVFAIAALVVVIGLAVGKYVFGAAHRDIRRVSAAILEPLGANALR